jgi:manganese transport protein
MALLLQSRPDLVVTQRDLAQASRETYSPFINYIIFPCRNCHQPAILRGFGMAIGINLLFDIPLIEGFNGFRYFFCYCS